MKLRAWSAGPGQAPAESPRRAARARVPCASVAQAHLVASGPQRVPWAPGRASGGRCGLDGGRRPRVRWEDVHERGRASADWIAWTRAGNVADVVALLAATRLRPVRVSAVGAAMDVVAGDAAAAWIGTGRIRCVGLPLSPAMLRLSSASTTTQLLRADPCSPGEVASKHAGANGGTTMCSGTSRHGEPQHALACVSPSSARLPIVRGREDAKQKEHWESGDGSGEYEMRLVALGVAKIRWQISLLL
ncbi:hypothetical protein AcV7_008756 [Taiwanofungus camphoratus]|nr:hypothetical protein AcW2_004752 [Antrodia cinnamomea]KAI0950219.1 hypothetical protein AcV7_008756 [Antrodia cinnamomea]